MRIVQVGRLALGLVIVLGVLAGLYTQLTTSTARAIPPDGPDGPVGDRCIPPPSGFDLSPELRGVLRLVDPPIVGTDVRLVVSNPKISVPSRRCIGRSTELPVAAFAWSVIDRPAGSTAALLGVDSFAPRLRPDRTGEWTVRFTACPQGCRVGSVVVWSLTRDLSFRVVEVVEGRLTSTEFADFLSLALLGSRVQLSHTDNGTPVYGEPYTVEWSSVPSQKLDELFPCADPRVTDPDPAECDVDDLLEFTEGHTTFRTIEPVHQSYIDFGLAAELGGAPDYRPIALAPIERDVPKLRASLLVAQAPVAALAALDIDRVRLLLNNIHADFGGGINNPLDAAIGGGTLNLNLHLTSSHPAVLCEAHYRVRAGFGVFTVSEGWADNLCPDFDLEPIQLAAQMQPRVVDGALEIADIQVTARLEPRGLTSEVYDVLRDVTGRAEEKVAKKLRKKLLETETKATLDRVLMAMLRNKFPDLERIVTARIEGTDLVVQYERAQLPGIRPVAPAPGRVPVRAP